MKKENKLKIVGICLLLVCSVTWGSGFVVLKLAIKNTPALFLIGLRFLISSIILGLIFIKKLKLITKKTLKRSTILAFFLAMAYLTQTIGLKFTTPSRNAFVTSLYCVFCPFFIAIIYKTKPKLQHLISAIACVIGIGFISFSGGISNNSLLLFGDGLTLISAVFFALQIIFIDRYKESEDSYVLLVVHMFISAIILLLCSCVFEIKAYGISSFIISKNDLAKFIYLTLVCTLVAQTCQIVGLKFVNPNEGAIILCLESVFGTIFSLALGQESLTVLLFIGFLFVFFAVVFSQIKISPIKKYSNKTL